MNPDQALNSKEVVQQDRPAVVRLEESLRDLVHEEMGHVREESSKPTPSRTDAFWLFLCVADAALLLWLLPDEKLSNKRIELVGKLVTWLGGSLFVVGYVWFRDLFLAYVRNRAFKITLVAVPIFLVPFYVTRMDIFPIAPVIEPKNAELEIDQQASQSKNLKLSLRSHDVTVKVKSQDKGTVYERPFNLHTSEVWRSWWNGEQPYWPVIFEVPVDFNREAPERIEIVKVEGSFDRDFKNSQPELTYQNEEEEVNNISGSWKDDGAIVFSWPYKPGVIGSIGLRLPYGKYRLTASFAEKEQCEKSTNITFKSKPDVESEKSSQMIAVNRKCS